MQAKLNRWVFEPGDYTNRWENGEVPEISPEQPHKLMMLTDHWEVEFDTSWGGPEDVNFEEFKSGLDKRTNVLSIIQERKFYGFCVFWTMNIQTSVMKLYSINFILVVLLSNCPILNAQFDSEAYDKNFFLLGTLNEYMGYQRTFTDNDDFYYQRIDILGQNELKHTMFIDSLFRTDYPDMTIVDNGASMGIKIYSPSLSRVIDEYYNYKESNTWTSTHDTIYAGHLKKEKFRKDKEKLSFILGAYLRFGQNKEEAHKIFQRLKMEKVIAQDEMPSDEIQVIFLANAPSKARLCAALLEELGCMRVEYYIRKSIPSGFFVFFSPSKKV